jgi:hypothetical protein
LRGGILPVVCCAHTRVEGGSHSRRRGFPCLIVAS